MHRIAHLIINLFAVILLISPSLAEAKEKNEFVVVIDPGHGGKDIGASDNGVNEKDINLKVALQLQSLINKKLKDTKVVMTRNKDVYLTLQERADKANNAKGDIFVSIHTNSVDKKNKNRKTVAGASVYALGLHKSDNNMQVAMRENSVIELESDYQQKYSGFDPSKDESYIIFEMAQKKNLSKSIKLAENIEKELVKSGRADRGVHQAGFWVLWATSMTSVLVELDFICNPESAKYISSDKGAKELAQAIFNAIENYEKAWRLSLQGINDENSGSLEYYLSDDFESENNQTELAPVAQKAEVKHNDAIKSPDINYATTKRRRRTKNARQRSLEIDFESPSSSLLAQGKLGTNSVSLSEEILPETRLSDEYVAPEKNKKKSKKEKKAEKNKNKGNSKVEKFQTVYKIQIYASSVLLNQDSPCFCGLSPVTAYKENNTFKYFYGESVDKKEMEALLRGVREKIPDAFIVKSTKSLSSKK